MITWNPGKDVPIPNCHGKCGMLMQVFDDLPRELRDFFNDEAQIQWCMCGVYAHYTRNGTAKTLAHFRDLERRYREAAT